MQLNKNNNNHILNLHLYTKKRKSLIKLYYFKKYKKYLEFKFFFWI
jgi:hypothetical protein